MATHGTIRDTISQERLVTPRQGVCDKLFLADFRLFSRFRAKINENLQEKGMMASVFARIRENQRES